MNFHLVALPHTNVNKEHSSCAFNQKVMKFGQMMKSLGHNVTLYSSEKYETSACDLHVTCISEEDRVACLNGKHYTQASFDYTLPHWKEFNGKVIKYMKDLIKPKDFICVIGGFAHKEIADTFPENMTVEFGIGYSGTFAKYRVFESYAWMHSVYGQQQGAQSAQGIWYDDVIPSYFNPDEFPVATTGDDYYLFVGRITPDKGVNLASEVCKKMRKRLIIAGPKFGQEPPEYGEYVGEVGPEERGRLMANATAVFVPSVYLEPFGSVAVEAQMCGTPVITTDWGAFVETVIPGMTGLRCRSFQEFCQATEAVKQLNRQFIRDNAQNTWSMEVVAKMYDAYFTRLMTLWGEGFYANY
jgi:glycosyltransferase involved in cell wall biosynthesis